MSYLKDPAAFGRLCVETIDGLSVINAAIAPAAFGRLCVETMGQQLGSREESQPPSGGCVLKQTKRKGRLFSDGQPPSGGCVLKQM